VSYTVCVALFVFYLSMVRYFVWYGYFRVLRLIVVPLQLVKPPFAAQLNNNNNNTLQTILTSLVERQNADRRWVARTNWRCQWRPVHFRYLQCDCTWVKLRRDLRILKPENLFALSTKQLFCSAPDGWRIAGGSGWRLQQTMAIERRTKQRESWRSFQIFIIQFLLPRNLTDSKSVSKRTALLGCEVLPSAVPASEWPAEKSVG
jgi:hypothetical protein